ncbi:MAG TPA: hypothetical protein VHJ82_04090 [Actinomycetota bacterium]|nr:hypothetical protein [Actinomycetota bacterium]
MNRVRTESTTRWRDIRTTAFILIVAGAIAQPAAGSFPGGRNGKIAIEDLGTAYGVVATVNPDGTALRRFCVPAQGCAQEFGPAWSPNGRRLAFSSDAAGFEHRIWSARVDGSERRRLTTLVGQDPAWSPDGSEIVFGVDAFGFQTDLYIVRADGTNLRRLTATRAVNESQPDWSPEGSRIAFRSEASDGEPRRRGVELINADGTGRVELAHAGYEGAPPSWSPDGTQIAFEKEGRIAIARVDGTAVRRLVAADSNVLAWSPDGTKIAFSKGERGIAVVDVNTGVVTPVFQGGRPAADSWQPVNCTITGTPAPDTLTGTPAPDVICGEGGDDTIRGVGREDFLYGDAGDDVIYATGAGEIVQGGDGDDVLYGTAGRNTLEGGAGNDILYGRGGRDFLSGGHGDDRIRAGPGNDTVLAEQGADYVSAGAGDDVGGGGPGTDLVTGGRGSDRVRGSRGNDRVRGGPGDDVVSGGAARDLLGGGSGDDQLHMEDGRRDFGIGGPGRDCAIFDVRLDRVRSATDCRPRGPRDDRLTGRYVRKATYVRERHETVR